MVSAGMDLEKPRPLQVLVGVRTSVTTGFFSIAACRANEGEGGVCVPTFQISGLRIHRRSGSRDLLFTRRLNDGSTLGATNDSVPVGALPLVANSFFCS